MRRSYVLAALMSEAGQTRRKSRPEDAEPYFSDDRAENVPDQAVSAIASAPQNVTRAVARKALAPPAFAPIAPRSARNPNDAAETVGTSAPAGETTTISKGIAAPIPTANVAADVSVTVGRPLIYDNIAPL